ncbi:MAG: hypothetical protein U0Q22_17430 [Acidimicrobiales bacterium]
MGNRSKHEYRSPRRSYGPPPGRNWNPFRTPGISPEDQSVFSPGGSFDNRYRALRDTRYFLDTHPRFRRIAILCAAGFGVAAAAKGIIGY